MWWVWFLSGTKGELRLINRTVIILSVSKIGMIRTLMAIVILELNFRNVPLGRVELNSINRIARIDVRKPITKAPVSPINILAGCQL